MSKVSYYTAEGLKKLRDELNQLKDVERPRASQDIAEARDKGDLSENAEYHAAKEQQGFIEGRIKEIEGKLANAQEVDITAINAQGKVVFGSTVAVIDLQNDQKITYRIVGEDESDIKLGMISYTSPIARALIGKSEGDEIIFQAPGGEKEYEILQVTYI